MKILKLEQGSPDWHAARRKWYRTASRAPVVMGASRFQTIDELMTELYTGVGEEVTPEKQARFDAGHATEKAATRILEQRHGEDLYTITGLTDDEYLLASLDGTPYSREWITEHKLLNQRVVAQIRAEKLEPQYYWQLEHQLIVCDMAQFARFICSDGTEKNFHELIYRSVPARRAQLLAGWREFDKAYAAFVPKQKAIPVVAKERETLPAVEFETAGEMVVKHNLPAVELKLRAFIDRTPKDPTTDQHFADIVQDNKTHEEFEAFMKGRVDTALSKAGPLYEFMTQGNALIELSAVARRANEKLVEAKKENIKLKALQEARDALSAHVAALNKGLTGSSLPDIPADFGAAAKNKRTVATLKAAVDAELLRAKTEASTIADTIRTNLALLAQQSDEAQALFADKAIIARKSTEDFATLVTLRIGEHERAEAAKAERIKAEATAAAEAAAAAAAAKVAKEAADAQAAAVAAAQAKAAAEAVEAERARVAAEAAAAPPAPAPAIEAATEPVQTTVFSAVRRTHAVPVPAPVAPPAEPVAADPDEVPTLTIGEINTRLNGPKVDGATLAALGFTPNKVKAASLYRESEFLPICKALLAHIRAIALAHIEVTPATTKEAA